MAVSAADEEILRRGARAVAHLRRFRKIDFFEPYVKQMEFFAAGAKTDERALIAANQVGKTIAGGFEDACHLTGEYPSWWPGHRFNHPIDAWIAGPTAEKVRDTTQQMLFGPWNKPDEFGTGFVPREAIVGRPTLARGVSGAYDTATIKWKDKNGRLDDSALSSITFKAFTEEQLAFASSTIDLYHGDEESKMGIYSEARVRLQVKKGISFVTLTPLLGRTEFVLWFDTHGHKTQMGIFDAVIGHDPARPLLGHYTKEDAEKRVNSFPAHERDARAYGVPMLGEGRVFLTDDRSFAIPRPDHIPPQWAKLWGIDFGGAGSGSHPFAAALMAWDRDYDVIYLLRALKLQGMTMLQHIPAIRRIAANVPVAWPHDGNERDRGGSGLTLAQQYKNPLPGMSGLLMLPDHATWPEGGFSTEAAVNDLDDRTKTGRFLVCDDLTDFFDEYRMYHREKGLLVKKDDDLLSAVFKGLMMKRFARSVTLGDDPHGVAAASRRSGMANDIDPFTGAAVPRASSMW